MDELTGKVAVVTGGASGIGLAMTRAFLDEGMKVVVADIEADALDDAMAGLPEGHRAPVGGVRREPTAPRSTPCGTAPSSASAPPT